MAKGIEAWTFTHGGYPDALHRSTLPDGPTTLKATELRIRVKAASLNPVDAQLMGYPMLRYVPTSLLPAEKGVGEDFAGVVEEAGSSAGFKPGDEVLGISPFLPNGTLQKTITLDTKSSQTLVVQKPADWSWEQAAALPLVWLTARTLVEGVEAYVPKSRGKVAILGGSSSCGMYAVHMARQRGWTVTATCSARNADFVKSMGADETIDYTTENVRQRMQSLGPIDAVIDCVGGTECLGVARRYVTVVGDKTNRMTMGGALLYLGNPQMVLRALLGKIGVGRSYACFNLAHRREYMDELVALPRDKIVIDSTFGFEQVKDGFERLNTGRARGKVVITLDD